MSEYKATQTSRRNFVLTMDEKVLGEINYEKWSSSKAALTLADGGSYQMRPKGFWQSTTEVLEGEHVLLSFKMNWRGVIEFSRPADLIAQVYRLKRKGFWKSTDELLDESGQQLLTVTPKYKWNSFYTEFQISSDPGFERTRGKELLLLFCICGINYVTKIAAASASA